MKKGSILMVAAMTLITAVSSYAQGPPRNVVYTQRPLRLALAGGITFPTAPAWFRDFHKTGFNLQGSLEYRFRRNIWLGGKVGYLFMKKDWDFIRPENPIGNADIDIWTFGFDVRWAGGGWRGRGGNHFFGGAGWARIKEGALSPSGIFDGNFDDTDPSEYKDRFYVNIGAGFELARLSGFSLIIEARYLRVFTKGFDISLIPVSLGLKF